LSNGGGAYHCRDDFFRFVLRGAAQTGFPGCGLPYYADEIREEIAPVLDSIAKMQQTAGALQSLP
jgi:hypothetical protein